MNKNESILKIKGGTALKGSTEIIGAKNAALPAIIVACMSHNTVELKNVPLELNDVRKLIALLKDNGADIQVNFDEHILLCNGKNWRGGHLDGDLAGSIRASLYLLGLSVYWEKDVELPIPGGCKLGQRKHDMHIEAFRALNNEVIDNSGIYLKNSESDDETIIEFYYPTFGGTLNVIFASANKDGKKVIIKNAAKNPEVIDVINMLNLMGAKINWEDKNTLIIEGVSELNAISYSIMPDRIVGATVIVATGVTKGQVKLLNFNRNLLDSEINTWEKSGLVITQQGNDLFIDGKKSKLIATDIETREYPGFHTDIQPLHVLLMTQANGLSSIKENILDGRFKYCEELNKLGTKIVVENGGFKCVNGANGQIAKVTGPTELKATNVKCTDIRGGAAVAVAGLVATGITTVSNLYQLERGYSNFVQLFKSLGADLERI